MNASLKLALGLCVLTLVTAMPNDMAKAKQGGSMRLQDLKPADMEETVNLLRRLMASKSTLEMAKFLDDPAAGVSTQDSISGNCQQNGNLLQCCVSVSVHKFWVISLDTSACLTGEYLSEELGVRFRLTVDGNTIINEVLSVRNPPLICGTIPYVPIVSICMRATNLDITASGTFSGCFAISVQLFFSTILTENLGCLQIN